jgi:hypothetical protein
LVRCPDVSQRAVVGALDGPDVGPIREHDLGRALVQLHTLAFARTAETNSTVVDSGCWSSRNWITAVSAVLRYERKDGRERGLHPWRTLSDPAISEIVVASDGFLLAQPRG